jgi:quercetin dioxygenase-like cupin family protein
MGKINLEEFVEFSTTKPVSKMLYDCEQVRTVLFCLEADQEVEPHTVVPKVTMLVISGRGAFIVGDQTHDVEPGSFVVCESNEAHGIKAKERMTVLVSIVPRP